MPGALIVSSGEKGRDMLCGVLTDMGAGDISTVTSGARALLFGAVKLAQAANRRIMGLQRQNNILQQKIDDIRLVDRAKCALIQYRLLTEPEAHKYIEREAMDSRRTRREVAQAILRMYEGGC